MDDKIKGVVVHIRGANQDSIIIDDDDNNWEYIFRDEDIEEGDFGKLKRGQCVYFEPDGDYATFIHVLDEIVPEFAILHMLHPKKYLPAIERQDTSPDLGDFLNPYNFVHHLHSKRKNHVLGDCPPPPHDRYVGLTGRITCEIEVKTPLFVSDSHAIEKQGKEEHFTYRFFEYDGKKALPASSLRGMIRSIFETMTNSCFSVFSKPDHRLEYRKEPNYANKLEAGIIKSLPTDNSNNVGEIVLCKTAKVGAYYYKKCPDKKDRDMLSDSKWNCGDVVWARITTGKNSRVWQIGLNRNDIKETTSKSKTVKGRLKITGDNIKNKKNEFLFIDPDSNSKTITFKKELMNDYNVVLKGQIKDKRLEGSLYQNEELTVGDLIWVETQNSRATNIVRVRIPRVRYDTPVNHFLPLHLHHCKEYNKLCPACRTFGWVNEPPDKGKEGCFAYAGRVRFTHAELVEVTLKEIDGNITLAILGSPKPTKTQFYLLDENGYPSPNIDYDINKAQLRGRKFYRHHKDEPSKHSDGYKYEQVTDAKNKQNRTVRGVVDKGTKFSFSLDFENLAPLELGALLWSLEMEDGMFHRLGYAKPLGFGSIKITVSSLETVNWKTRLESLDKQAGWEDVIEKKQGLIDEFKAEMHKLYSKGDTEHSPEFKYLLKELKAILKPPDDSPDDSPDDLPVHYPRPDPPDQEGKNFKWFTDNKNKTLALAVEDKGLTV